MQQQLTPTTSIQQREQELLGDLCAIKARQLLFLLANAYQEMTRAYGPTRLLELTYSGQDRQALSDSLAESLLNEMPPLLKEAGAATLSEESLARLLRFFIDGHSVHTMASRGIPLVVQRPEFRAYVRQCFSLSGARPTAAPPTAARLSGPTGGAQGTLAQDLPLPVLSLVVGQRGARAVSRRTRRSAGRAAGRAAGGV